MVWFWLALATTLCLALLWASMPTRLTLHIFGGYIRECKLRDGSPTSIRLAFHTRRRAERYGLYGLSTIDPYATRMVMGPPVFVPGKWFRKSA